MTAKAFNKSATLAALSGSFLALWSAIALFPLFWIALMSVRVPVDALSSNPLNVILGPATREIVGGLSLAHVAAGAGLVAAVLAFARGDRWLWAFAGLTGALAVGAMAGIPGLRGLDIPIIGFTAAVHGISPSPSAARSAAVNTPFTPGSARAAVASMPRMTAWACGERRT